MSYKNRDSYQLMEYTCGTCSKVEFIWNGRDNVSPFTVGCTLCAGTMQHSNWHKDRQLPDYIVPTGDRYFTDYTPERLILAVKECIHKFDGSEYEVKEGTEEYKTLTRSLMADFLRDGMDLVVQQ